MTTFDLKGYFKRTYGPLKGRTWLKGIPEQEQKAFAHIGRHMCLHGRMGGAVRAQTAQRDNRGRFLPNGGNCETY